MTIDCDNKEFRINDGLWKGYSLFQLYKEALLLIRGMKNYLGMQMK